MEIQGDSSFVHLVQFYDDNAFPAELIAEFFHAGLLAGESAMMIATPGQAEAISACLEKLGVTDGAAKPSRIKILDAKKTLRQLMTKDEFDHQKLSALLDEIVPKAGRLSKNGNIRVFGSMTTILAEQGEFARAVELESIWNQFSEKLPLRVYCAYPMRMFESHAAAKPFQRICDNHDHIVPVEEWLGDSTRHDKGVALLQQQTLVLQSEVNERRRAEDKFKNLLESAPDALAIVDAAGKIRIVNSQTEKVFGYAREELYGQPIEFLMPKRFRESHPDYWQNYFQNPKVRAMGAGLDLYGLHKDGHEFPVDISLSPFHSADGLLVIAAIRNIIDRRQAELALRQSQQQFAAIFNLSPIPGGIVRLSDLQIVDVNEAALRMLGYDRDDIIGYMPQELDIWQDLDKLQALLEAFQEGNPIRNHETQFRTRFDGIRDVVINAELIDLNGEVCAVGMVHDITDRKRAARALEASERKFRALVENSRDVILVVDAEAKILYVSPALEREFGYSKDELMALPPLAGTNPEEVEEAKKLLGEILNTPGRPTSFQLRRKHKDGSWVWVEGVATNLLSDASVQGIVVNFSNITDRKLAEQRRAVQLGVSRVLAEARTLDEAAPHIVEALCESLEWDVGELWLIDHEAALIRQTCTWSKSAPGGDIAAPSDATFVLGEGLPGLVWQTARLEWISDLANHPNILSPETAAKCDACGAVGFPILLAGHVLGVVTLLGQATCKPDEDLQNVMLAVGSQIGQLVERTRTESALRDSEERYRAVTQSAHDAIVTVDAHGKITSWNDGARKIFGFRENEALNQPFTILLPERYKRLSLKVQRDSTSTLIGTTREIHCRRKDGTVFPIEFSLARLKTRQGQYYTGIIRDITGRKQTQRALRLSQDRFFKIFHTSPIGISITTLGTGTFTDINAAGLRTLGYQRKEIIGHTAADLRIWADSERRDEFVQLLKKKGFVRDFETRIRIKSGDLRDILGYCELLKIGDQPCILSMFYDVTDRKNAEQALLQAQKLESLGVLAGGIAHDFNNLLVGVLGNASLGLMEVSSESPVRPILEEIQLAGRRAADLANQMLAYSGRGHFVVEPVNLNTLVKEITHLMHASIGKNVVLKLELAEDLPAVKGDVTQLHQVVMNLVVNGAEAIGAKNGVIVIRTGTCNLNAGDLNDVLSAIPLAEGEYVFLEVEDTGVGIDFETQRKIFDPFFSTKFTGRGLGLATVFGVLRGHKGGIKVKSEPVQGTTFCILIPALQRKLSGKKRDKPGRSDAKPSALKGVVLIIDDDAGVCTVTARMLEQMGLTPIVAPDGKTGLDIFIHRADEIDCVLLDLTMPHPDGEEVLNEIRKKRQDACVILMSGYDKEEVTARFSGKAPAGFLQKPFLPETLRTLLRGILNKSRHKTK